MIYTITIESPVEPDDFPYDEVWAAVEAAVPEGSLVCTSDSPTEHQGDTCPIHEREEA